MEASTMKVIDPELIVTDTVRIEKNLHVLQ